jgi:hypothetical protein
MQRVKAVRVNEPEPGGGRRRHCATGFKQQNNTMKTLTKLALALVLIATAAAAPAQTVRGYLRSNGTYVAPHYRSDYGSLGGSSSSSYVYRNPYAADPSVNVRSYQRYDGTTVDSYVRTPANNTLTDNLNYRGYGTIRVPRY